MVPIEAATHRQQSATARRRFNVPASRIWRVISDLQHPERFHPDIQHADMTSTRDRGVDAERVCHLSRGRRLTERFTGWTEGVGYTATWSQSSLPVRDALVAVRIRPVDVDHAEVNVEIKYHVPGGLLGRIFDAVVIHAALQRSIERVLHGLEGHLAGIEAQRHEEPTLWSHLEPGFVG